MGRNNGRLKAGKAIAFAVCQNGDSLWSAGVRDRFGSRLRALQSTETRDAVGLFPIIAAESKLTTKAVPNARTPKAPPI
jgi:hypothetical protein